MNRTLKDATVKRHHYERHDRLRTHLQLFLDAYNHARRPKTLRGLTPYEHVLHIWTTEPERFKLNPPHHIPGPHMRPGTLDRRLAALDELLAGAETAGWIRLSEEVQADGMTLLRHACEHGLEGIIAKDQRNPYRSGGTTDWLKIKCIDSEGFAVVGSEPSSVAPGGLGRLLLACREGDGLVYADSVGTGFTETTARALRRQLDGLKRETPVIKPNQHHR